MDPKLREQLIRDEGERLEAYQDSLGNWTIGIGHLLGETKRMISITAMEMDALFTWDCYRAEQVADRCIPLWKSLDPPRQRVILNMAFNLGPRLLKFVDFRAAVALSDWTVAAKAMEASVWFHQVGARAVRLRDTILTGID